MKKCLLMGAMSALALNLGSPNVASADESILGAHRVAMTASSEIEAFVCSFNAEGGMITEIVSTALAAVGHESGPALEFVRDPLTVDLAATARSGRIVFPMYKPRCDEQSLLNVTTAELCHDLNWSDPIFHVVMSGYVASDRDWMPTGNSQLIGRTICQPKGQSAFYFTERGLTDLNARIVYASSPMACLKQVEAGESDVAVLPMIAADPAIKGGALGDSIRHVANLDMILSVHAIAGGGSPEGAESIEMLNRGLQSIRSNGEWFKIVKEHSGGHSHGERHAAHVSE